MNAEQTNRIEQLKGETFAQLAVIFSSISQAELELGWSRKDKAAVYKFRDKFAPANPALTVDQAKELMETYRLEAAKELAQDETIGDLTRERDGLSRRIDFETRKLSAAFSEFHGIPAKVAKIDQEVQALKSAVEELNSLEAIFTEAFQTQLASGSDNNEFLSTVGAAIATRPLRLPLLADAISKKEVERKKNERRANELAKELKQKPHVF